MRLSNGSETSSKRSGRRCAPSQHGPLWWVLTPRGNITHLSRSNLAGTFTECGIELERGWYAERVDRLPAVSGCPGCLERSQHLARATG